MLVKIEHQIKILDYRERCFFNRELGMILVILYGQKSGWVLERVVKALRSLNSFKAQIDS